VNKTSEGENDENDENKGLFDLDLDGLIADLLEERLSAQSGEYDLIFRWVWIYLVGGGLLWANCGEHTGLGPCLRRLLVISVYGSFRLLGGFYRALGWAGYSFIVSLEFSFIILGVFASRRSRCHVLICFVLRFFSSMPYTPIVLSFHYFSAPWNEALVLNKLLHISLTYKLSFVIFSRPHLSFV
jgi:hypothetical protein